MQSPRILQITLRRYSVISLGDKTTLNQINIALRVDEASHYEEDYVILLSL